MPYIPQEILDIIISFATVDRPNFSNCASLVSHTFHQIVLPYKFRSFVKYYHLTGVSKIPKFCEAINAGDAHALSLAPLVQELRLQLWHVTDMERTIDSFLSFQNLTKLSMQRCLTSPAIMEQLGRLLQLQSLDTFHCALTGYGGRTAYGGLSNLQSLHTLECHEDNAEFSRSLACISMKNLRILKSSDFNVIQALLTTYPTLQLKELWLTRDYHDSAVKYYDSVI